MKPLSVLCLVLAFCLPVFADDIDCLTFNGTPVPGAQGEFDAAWCFAADMVNDDLLAMISSGGFYLVDISDVSSPSLVSSTSLNWFYDVEVRGDRAYFAASFGFGYIDITDPANLVEVVLVADSASKLAFHGDLVSVTHYEDSVIYDLSDPDAPVLVSTLPDRGTPVFLDDQRLALLWGGLTIYDITDPAAPVETHRLDYNNIPGGGGRYVRSLIPWGDTVIGRVDYTYSIGSIQYGTYEEYHSHARVQFDLSAPGEPVVLDEVPTGRHVFYSIIEPLGFPLIRVGDLLIDGKQVVAPASGSLETVTLLPGPQPKPGGLQVTSDQRLLMLAYRGLISVPLDGIDAANTCAMDVLPVDADGFRAAAVDGDLLVQSRVITDGWDQSTRFEYGSSPGGEFETLGELSGTNFDVLAAVDDDVFVATSWYTRVYRITDSGVVEEDLSLTGVSAVVNAPGSAVIVMQDQVVNLLDMADGQTPELLGSLDLSQHVGAATVNHVTSRGDLLLVSSDQGLSTVSLGGELEFLGNLDLGDAQWASWRNTDQVVVLAGDQLHDIALSDPAAPGLMRSVPAGLAAGPLVWHGSVVYSLNDDMVVGLGRSTLEVVGVMVLPTELNRLHIWSDFSLLGCGRLAAWQTLPSACEVLVTLVDGEVPTSSPRLGVYPNPFNPQATVRLRVTQPGPARLQIFDLRGRCLRDLDLGHIAAGEHQVTWNGRDQAGRDMPTGIYMLRLTTADGGATAKAALVR